MNKKDSGLFGGPESEFYLQTLDPINAVEFGVDKKLYSQWPSMGENQFLMSFAERL